MDRDGDERRQGRKERRSWRKIEAEERKAQHGKQTRVEDVKNRSEEENRKKKTNTNTKKHEKGEGESKRNRGTEEVVRENGRKGGKEEWKSGRGPGRGWKDA